MSEVRHIAGDAGPEIVGEIGTGLIINHAKWSGHSQMVYKRALQDASDIGIRRIFVTDHDLSQRLVELFVEDGNHRCQGWGDLLYVIDGKLHEVCHKFDNLNDIRPWLITVVGAGDNQ